MDKLPVAKSPSLSSQQCYFHQISEEVFMYIVSFLPVPDKARLGLVDRYSHNISCDRTLQRRRIEFAANKNHLGSFLNGLPNHRLLAELKKVLELTPEEAFAYIESREFEQKLKDIGDRELAKDIEDFAHLALAEHVDRLLDEAFFPQSMSIFEQEEAKESVGGDLESGEKEPIQTATGTSKKHLTRN